MSNKVFLIAFLVFILIVPFASAKTIVYVTENIPIPGAPCSDLDEQDDRLFCQRLESLGYTVKTIGDTNVRDNSSTWQSYYQSADMIFLGDVSDSMVDKTRDQGKFCGNITSVMTPQRTLFAAFENTIKADTIEGCAFASGMVSWSYSNNRCTKKWFRILKEGYITEGYKKDNNTQLYGSSHVIKVHEPPYGGWVGAEWKEADCSVGPLTNFFPVINTSWKGAFWGLDNAYDFNDKAWNFFDRTVWTAINDTAWIITPYVIPEFPTKNQIVWVGAKIKLRDEIVKDGVVNFTANDIFYGNLIYENNFWWNKTVKFDTQITYKLNINGYDNFMRRGEAEKDINVGNLSVIITSGDYSPGSDYKISAEIYSGENPQPVEKANYTIWSNNFTVIKSGTLGCESGSNKCSSIISTSNWGQFILEVNAFNSSIASGFGGSLKIVNVISKLEPIITTDKTNYRPEETIKVNVYTTAVATEANLTVIKPDQTIEAVVPLTKNTSNSTHWYKDYTIGKSAANGNYTLNVKTTMGGPIEEVNKTIAITAWNTYIALDKIEYDTGNILKLNIQMLNVYSNINFTIKATSLAPDNNVLQIGNGSIRGNGSLEINYTIPTNSIGGSYKMFVYINDSDNRALNTSSDFTIKGSSGMIVIPSSWNVITSQAGTRTQSFTITNNGTQNMTNIIISAGGNLASSITFTTSSISSINVGQTANFTAYLSVTTEGDKTGTININSNIAQYVISVNLSYHKNVSLINLVSSPNSWSVVTIPDKIVTKTFILSNTHSSEDAINIVVNIPSNLNFMSIVSKPSSIESNDHGNLELKVDTSGLSENSYSGSIQISSSVGSAQISTNIEIIGDLSAEADEKLAELNSLSSNITELEKKKKNVTEIKDLYDNIESLLNDVKSKYQAGNYAEAKTKYETATSDLSDLKSRIQGLYIIPKKGYGFIIWIFAIIVILLIIGITIYKYKDKIIELINRILKKEEPQPEYPGYEYPYQY